jgi:hypothetical protein
MLTLDFSAGDGYSGEYDLPNSPDEAEAVATSVPKVAKKRQAGVKKAQRQMQSSL